MKHYIFIVEEQEENNITQVNSLSIGYYTGVYAIPQSHTLILLSLMLVSQIMLSKAKLLNKCYVSGTDEYTKYLVTQTSKYNKLIGTNISMYRSFTSVSVAKWALDEQSITTVGTMRRTRKGIPKELKMLDGREKKSTMYVY